MNDEGFTAENARGLAAIAVERNEWRRRLVRVYQHPTAADKVVTVGEPFEGGPPIVCVEPREGYARAIAVFPRTAVFQ